MSAHAKASRFHPVRRDRLIQEPNNDRTRAKTSGTTVCPKCGVVCQEGRWQWASHPREAREAICPACQRVRDRRPAGFVHLAGDFFAQHRQEALRLAEKEAMREATAHPLERIIDAEEEDGGLLMTTTGIQVARRIGDALERAYQGHLELHYNQDEQLLRVHWRR
jgi:hypothetical protein